jgi:hypothetical protein
MRLHRRAAIRWEKVLNVVETERGNITLNGDCNA